MPEAFNIFGLIPAVDPSVSELVPSFYGPEGAPKAADQWRQQDFTWAALNGLPWTLRVLFNTPLKQVRVLLIDPDGHYAEVKPPYRADIVSVLQMGGYGDFGAPDFATGDDPYANVTGANIPQPV